LLCLIADGDPARLKGCCRKTALRLGPTIFTPKGAIMKCDICGQDVDKSEDLQKHNELVHPTGVGDASMDNLEKPDHLGDTPEESAETEIPLVTH
jgi:hypothetical protein